MRSVFLSLFPLRSLDGQERRLVLLLWLMGVLQGLAQSPLSAILPYTRLGLGLTGGQMSLVLAITRLASLGAIGFSWWADRAGRRRPFLVAYTALILASGATSVAPNAGWFTASQGVVRIATTAVGTLAVVLLAEGIRGQYRAFVIGLYAAAGSLGAGLGQLMLPIAAKSPDAWRIAFAVPLVGLLAIPTLRKVQESPLRGIDVRRVPVSQILVGPHARHFWIAGVGALSAAAFPAVALAFTNERLVNGLGYSAAAATVLALSGGTIGALGFWLGGRMADVWGRRPTTIVALAASVAGGVALFEVESIPALLVAIAIGGFGAFSYVPAASSHRAELFPTEVRATAGSAGAYLATVGSALGLGFGAGVIDRFGLTKTLLVLSIPMAIAAVLTLALPETKNAHLGDHG